MVFEIPDDKFTSILEEAKFFIDHKKHKFFPVKKLASWVGKLQSLRLAIGPVVSIMCRSLYGTIKDAKTWSSYVRLGIQSLFELQWWFDNLQHYTTYPINISSQSVIVDA